MPRGKSRKRGGRSKRRNEQTFMDINRGQGNWEEMGSEDMKKY